MITGLSLLSGGLDSQLAVKVLQLAGANVEGVCFSTPFFSPDSATRAADALKVKLHVIDFTDDEVALLKNPPHGFGGAMNPCIDCHATMIRRAGELMTRLGYGFVATGEVMGQRPMSQNKQALTIVAKSSGLLGRLIRPLCAKLLDPTEIELTGEINREKLLDISGRSRERQIALAKEFGITNYPSPAGGCKLTEEAYSKKLRDLLEHEGLDDRRLIELLCVGRHFRLTDGTSLIVGRDKTENDILDLESARGTIIDCGEVPGPHALLVGGAKSNKDAELAKEIIFSYTKNSTINRDAFKEMHIC